MKNNSRKLISLFKKIFVIALAVLSIVLLAAAIITLNNILFILFSICLAVYMAFLLVETVIKPILRMK